MMNIASRKSTVTAVATTATTFLSTCNRPFKICEFYSKSSQLIPRTLPSFSSVISPKTSALSHTHNTNNIIKTKRNLISTSSYYEPPIPLQDGFVERPGIIVSLRSHCQSTSDVDRKDEYLGNEFSRRGVSYKGIQLPSTSSSSFSKIQYNDLISNGCYEINKDIQSLEQPNVILLAHGPIPSLVAQYYLESFSLAGLVMIDPFLVPFSKESLESSGRELLQRMNENDGECEGTWNDDRTTLESIMSSITTHSEIEDGGLRTLKLESGSVPMLVLSTQQHSSLVLHTNLKKNLDEIAQYHSHEHYTFPPVKVITLEGKDNDLYQSMVKEVYTWIDDDFVL